MKKILYVIPSLGAGGAEKTLILVANALTRQYGYSVSILVFSDDLYYRELLDSRVRLITHNLYKNKSRIQSIISTYIRCAIYLKKQLSRQQYDIVVSGYEIDAELPIIEVILANVLLFRKKTIRYVSVLQASMKGIHQKHGSRRNLHILHLIEFLRWRLFHKIIVVAPSMLNECPASVHDRISVIPNPVDSELVRNLAVMPLNEGVLKQAYFINIARISHQKNQLCLVRAFNAIKTQTDWNLVVLGTISNEAYYREVTQMIEREGLTDRIFYLGTPVNPYPYLKNARAFVFSSRYEGYSLAILEAMALKKTIISTRFIGYENILSDCNAVLVENENERQLAQAMLAIATGTLKTASLTENALSLVAACEISTVALHYHTVFCSL
ncbi:MAG: glycosyltransferase [Acidobacteriota bacterium]